MKPPRSPHAWILTGGWSGHDPEGVAAWSAERLAALSVSAEVVRDLDALDDAAALDGLALLVPNWSWGSLSPSQETALVTAVERGLGLVGTHGGMGDTSRASLKYQWLVGGQFVAHPGDLYPHRVTFDPGSPLLGDLPPVELITERYVMLIDPAVSVHARLTFGADPMPWLDGVQVPVAWTRRWGEGRVGYLSVGHTVDDLRVPAIVTAFERLADWARGDRPRG